MAQSPELAEPLPAASAEPRGPDAPRLPEATPRSDTGARAAQQVAVALAASHEGHIEVALDPEDLGPVRLALQPGDGTITVHLAAERAETLDLLRRHADLLARELREAGYRDVSFRFGSDTPPDGNRGPPHRYEVPAPGEPAPLLQPLAPTAARRGATAPGALDLRL